MCVLLLLYLLRVSNENVCDVSVPFYVVFFFVICVPRYLDLIALRVCTIVSVYVWSTCVCM